MTKAWKLLLGALTIWPIVYIALFFGAAFYSILIGQTKELTGIWNLIIPLHLFTILIIFALMIFYVVNVVRNVRIKSDMKAVWAIVVVLGGPIGLPIYWYFLIWKDTDTGASSVGSGPSLTSTQRIEDHSQQPAYIPPAQPPDWR